MSLLAIAIVSKNRERAVTKKLIAEKFTFTRVGSTGGFLRKRSATLLIGLQDSKRLARLKEIFSKAGKERSALVSGAEGSLGQETGSIDVPVGAARLKMGGSTLFIVNVEEIQQY